MLLGILPAFRDVRAPLVAGYVLLLAGWLLFHDYVMSQEAVPGSPGALFEVVRKSGHTGALVLATFAAFILGSLTQFGAESVARYRNRRRGGARHDLQDDSDLRSYIGRLLSDSADLRAAAREEPGAAGLTDAELGALIVQLISSEISRIARRMRGSENELFDEYDRLIAEAQLREITFIPLPVLFLVISATWSWLFVVAVGALPLLKRQAVYQREDGHAVIVDAILVGKVASPSLERLQRRAEELGSAGPGSR